MLLNSEKREASRGTKSRVGILSKTFRDDTHPAVNVSSHVPYVKHTWDNDCTITTKDRRIDASKNALKSISGYFHDLCASDPSLNRAELTVGKGENLQAIVDFAHSGYVTISAENVFERYEAARYFRVPFMIKVCTDFLTTLIHSNCQDACWVRQGALQRSWLDIYCCAKVYQDIYFERMVHGERCFFNQLSIPIPEIV